MRDLDAVIFDMDGTLLDTGAPVANAVITTVREVTNKAVTANDVFRVWGGGTPQSTIAPLIGRPLTTDEVDIYVSEIEQEMARLEPYRRVRETIDLLLKSFPLGVVTGASRRVAELCLEGTDLLRHFAVIVTADDIEHSKPHPEGILRGCQTLGVDSTRVAYVGDSLHDMRAARACGAFAILAAWGHSGRATAPDEVDLVVDDPMDLSVLLEKE